MIDSSQSTVQLHLIWKLRWWKAPFLPPLQMHLQKQKIMMNRKIKSIRITKWDPARVRWLYLSSEFVLTVWIKWQRLQYWNQALSFTELDFLELAIFNLMRLGNDLRNWAVGLQRYAVVHFSQTITVILGMFYCTFQLQQKHPELATSSSLKFPSSSDSWMGGSSSDPTSEFVLKRKLDLEVSSIRCWLLTTYLSFYLMYLIYCNSAGVLQDAVRGLPRAGPAPTCDGLLRGSFLSALCQSCHVKVHCMCFIFAFSWTACRRRRWAWWQPAWQHEICSKPAADPPEARRTTRTRSAQTLPSKTWAGTHTTALWWKPFCPGRWCTTSGLREWWRRPKQRVVAVGCAIPLRQSQRSWTSQMTWAKCIESTETSGWCVVDACYVYL